MLCKNVTIPIVLWGKETVDFDFMITAREK
jgi:hypothetical protein